MVFAAVAAAAALPRSVLAPSLPCTFCVCCGSCAVVVCLLSVFVFVCRFWWCLLCCACRSSPASWFVFLVSSLFWMVCGVPSLTSQVSVTGYALRYLPKHCAPHLHLTSSQHFCHRKFPVCLFSHWSATANVPVKVMTADEQAAAVNTLVTTLEAILRIDIQAALAQLEVNTCEVFALIESATERLKEWPHADVCLERNGGDKVQAARVAAAWEAAVAQWQQDNEQRAAGLSALTPSSAIVSARRAGEDFPGMEDLPNRRRRVPNRGPRRSSRSEKKRQL